VNGGVADPCDQLSSHEQQGVTAFRGVRSSGRTGSVGWLPFKLTATLA